METNKLITRWIVNKFYQKYHHCEYLGEREEFIAKIATELTEVYKEIIRKENKLKNSKNN